MTGKKWMKVERHTRFMFYGALLTLFTASVFSSGCMQNAFLRGRVYDVSGQELPGVVVRVIGTEYEGLSNGNGIYSLRSASGELELEFAKTGYAPVRQTVSVPSLGIFDIEPVQLWPIPVGEGVYTFENFRYRQTDHPRVNRYNIQDAGFAYGTPVEPSLEITYADPKESPDRNPPPLIAHKMSPYDARLHKLRKVNAAMAHTGAVGRGDKSKRDIQYTEEVWIADEAIQITTRPLDEPERLLLEMRATRPLTPGVYAIHWGALEGYDSIDPRVFLFEVIEPVTENVQEADEDEKTSES